MAGGEGYFAGPDAAGPGQQVDRLVELIGGQLSQLRLIERTQRRGLIETDPQPLRGRRQRYRFDTERQRQALGPKLHAKLRGEDLQLAYALDMLTGLSVIADKK